MAYGNVMSTSQRLSLRLPQDVAVALHQKAKTEDRPLSRIVIAILRHGLKLDGKRRLS